MEKLLYSLWREPRADADSFREVLVEQLCRELAQLADIHGVRVSVVDSEVLSADARRMVSQAPAPDALLSLWVDSTCASAAWESMIDQCVARRASYLVAEAEPLPSQKQHPAAPGDRVYGMCQVVFFRKPAELDRTSWLALWQDSHTGVALATQSTFGYRHNVVVRALGEDTPGWDAIVEENFPPQAMTCDHAFFASGGDDALLEQHMNSLMASCAHFIDFEHIDVLPMSEYLIKPLSRH